MSMPPASATPSSIHARAASLSPRSTGLDDAIWPPAARTSATVSCAPSTSRSQPTTRAPSAANSCAAARPWPPAVPVMKAILPSRRAGCVISIAAGTSEAGDAVRARIGPEGVPVLDAESLAHAQDVDEHPVVADLLADDQVTLGDEVHGDRPAGVQPRRERHKPSEEGLQSRAALPGGGIVLDVVARDDLGEHVEVVSLAVDHVEQALDDPLVGRCRL